YASPMPPYASPMFPPAGHHAHHPRARTPSMGMPYGPSTAGVPPHAMYAPGAMRGVSRPEYAQPRQPSVVEEEPSGWRIGRSLWFLLGATAGLAFAFAGTGYVAGLFKKEIAPQTSVQVVATQASAAAAAPRPTQAAVMTPPAAPSPAAPSP